MAPAVSAMASRGRRPRRTVSRATEHRITTTASRDGHLHPEQGGQRLLGGLQGDGRDQGALGDPDRRRLVGRAPRPQGAHREGLGQRVEDPVAAAEGLRGRGELDPQMAGQDGLGVGVAGRARRAAHQDPAPRSEDLGVDVGAHPLGHLPAVRRPAGGVLVDQVVVGLMLGHRQLFVDPAEQEAVDGGVGHQVGRPQPDHQQDGDGQGEPAAQAHGRLPGRPGRPGRLPGRRSGRGPARVHGSAQS